MNPKLEDEIGRIVDNEIRLHALLQQDLGESPEVENYLPVIKLLRRWSAPKTTQQQTDQLITQLLFELPSSNKAHHNTIWESYSLALLYSQLKVVKREIWFASLFIILLGLLVTITAYDLNSKSYAPITIVAPIIGAFGIGLLYDADARYLLELESTTRTSKQAILLARLTLVYSFNLLLMLGASGIIALTSAQISLLPLISSWFMPMTFLSALAFFVSVISQEVFLGWSISFGIWSLHVILFTRNTVEIDPILHALSLPGLAEASHYPILLILAILLIGIAIWISDVSESVSSKSNDTA